VLRLFRRLGKAITGQPDQNDEGLMPAAVPSTTPPLRPPRLEPIVIARPEHKLSRKRVNTNALKVMGRLIRHGHKAYLCGGCVRDILIDRKPKDFDVVTDARPDQIKALFRNCRLIGRRFRLAHIYFKGGEIIEVSTFRKLVPFDPDSDSPTQDENTYGTPADDAHRRDLTINGLFYDLENFAIYDFVDGIEDLKNGVIRIIGNPGERIREDPVRIIRAIRHAAGTGFTIEEETFNAIRQHAGEIAKANSSRVRDEFMRELCDGHAQRSFELMLETDLLFALMPAARSIYNGTNPHAEDNCRYLLANLKGIDGAVKRKKSPSLPVKLAAFMAPMVKAQDFEARVNNPRQRRSTIQRLTRDYVKPMLREVGVGKADSEAATMILLGVKAIHRAISKGPNLPKSLLRKSYFNQSLQLYQIEAFGRGERLPAGLTNIARDRGLLIFGQRSNRKRRRRPRKGNRPQQQSQPANRGNGKEKQEDTQASASPGRQRDLAFQDKPAPPGKSGAKR